jgi:arginase family enzyme
MNLVMQGTADQQVCFFGCSFDCDEQYDSIQEKCNGIGVSQKTNDPLASVLEVLEATESLNGFQNAGRIEVPSWLLPNPDPADLPRITTESFTNFIDEGGCLAMAQKVQSFVAGEVLPAGLPCMIGIDHCLTGGAYKAVSDYYGKENVSLLVIDTHTDAIPMSAHADAIQYDIDVNPSSVYDPNDPYLYNRPDSYNASSFLYHMLQNEDLIPRNLIIMGVSDYPEKKTFRIKDERIRRYTSAFSSLKRKGCKIITKKDCQLGFNKVKTIIKNISTPYVYISVDMDIGACNALNGVRFLNWKGLDEKMIFQLMDAVSEVFARNIRLAGMDIVEINPRKAGKQSDSGKDKTYEIAAEIIEKLLFKAN